MQSFSFQKLKLFQATSFISLFNFSNSFSNSFLNLFFKLSFKLSFSFFQLSLSFFFSPFSIIIFLNPHFFSLCFYSFSQSLPIHFTFYFSFPSPTIFTRFFLSFISLKQRSILRNKEKSDKASIASLPCRYDLFCHLTRTKV